jgi:hypothetical protein
MRTWGSPLSNQVTRLKDNDRQKLTKNKRQKAESYLPTKMPTRIWSDAESKFVDMTPEDIMKFKLNRMNKARE